MTGSKARWDRVQELFHAAGQMAPSERADFLARECNGDDDLLGQVESLLRFGGEPTSLLHRSIGDAAALAAALEQPQQIGAYKVVRLIGRGGMGAVYEAFRADDQFQKRVAIKVMYPGLHNDRLLERFRAERQILANLEHPYIARLLDGGALPSALPYLVMEFVEGVPIDRFAGEKKLDTRARLLLMRRVFEGVEYAHRNLVIHRDLKPANILVTAEGEPKLVDFGIAKLLDPAASGATRTMEIALTPEYASPEQVRGEATTTATDVYALGAMLYELLTGTRHLDLRGSTPGEIERIICGTDAPKPSAVAARKSPTLARELEGDLDTIILKALRKEPAQRYATVDRFSDDVRRYLEKLPITARPSTLGYQSLKFVRRHPAAVMSSAAALLFLILFGLGMTVLARRLAIERDRATEQEARAQQVSDFLTGIFKLSDPGEARGNKVTARDVLDRGAASVAQNLGKQPQVQAAMLDTMAKAYQGLGLYGRAQTLYEDSLRVRRRYASPGDRELARSYLNIANEMYARDVDYDGAETLARNALDIYRRASTQPSAQIAESLALLGKLAVAKGKYQDGIKLQRQALAIDNAVSGPQTLAVAQNDFDLAAALYFNGDLSEAESYFEKSLAIHRRLLGDGDPGTLDTMEGFGLDLDAEAKLGSAEVYLRKVLAGRRKLYGEYHHGTAVALSNLGDVLSDEKKLDEAASLYQEAIQVQDRTVGDMTASTAGIRNELALLFRAQRQYAKAEAEFRKTCETFKRSLGAEHPHYALCLGNLADVLASENSKLPEAEADTVQAIAIQRKAFGDSSYRVAKNDTLLGRIREARGNFPGAETAFREALSMIGKDATIPPAVQAYTQFRYGAFLDKTHRAALAEPLLVNALTLQVKLSGANSPDAAEVQQELARCRANMNRPPPPIR